MNEKLTLPVLARLMSEMSGRSRRQCEEFIRELFSLLSDTLSAGEDINVRGLGSFRIIDVEERKSVNVATGREFIIAGHKKVVFTPASGLASAVNQAFDMFTPVEVSDSVDAASLASDIPSEPEEEFDSDYDIPEEDSEVEEPAPAQAPATDPSADDIFIKGELPERGEEPVPADPENNAFSSTSSDLAEYVLEEEEDSAVITEDLPKEKDEADKDEDHDDKNENGEEDDEDDDKDFATSYIPFPRETPTKEKQGGFLNCKFCWGLLIGFLSGMLFVAVGYCIYEYVYLYDYLHPKEKVVSSDAADEWEIKARLHRDSILRAREREERNRRFNALMARQADSARQAAPVSASADEVDTHPSDTPRAAAPVEDVITTTRYLTTVAREHYGNDAFWPYIYEENKAFLGHPDRIRPGTKIIVPPLSKYGVDAKNPNDIKKAKRMGVEIYSRYRK